MKHDTIFASLGKTEDENGEAIGSHAYYLVKLAQHTYSNLFGTFLCNSLAERKQHTTREQTRSVWDFLKHHPYKFRNLLYSSSNGTIIKIS